MHIAKHRGLVVDSVTFVIPGDRSQLYEWPQCGLRLYVPQGIVKENEQCEIKITVLSGGKFHFPNSTELASVVYDIEVSKSLDKEFSIEVQHCVLLKVENHLKNMSFAYASYPPPDTSLSSFQFISGGEFHINCKCGIFRTSKTGSYCILLKR